MAQAAFTRDVGRRSGHHHVDDTTARGSAEQPFGIRGINGMEGAATAAAARRDDRAGGVFGGGGVFHAVILAHAQGNVKWARAQ